MQSLKKSQRLPLGLDISVLVQGVVVWGERFPETGTLGRLELPDFNGLSKGQNILHMKEAGKTRLVVEDA